MTGDAVFLSFSVSEGFPRADALTVEQTPDVPGGRRFVTALSLNWFFQMTGLGRSLTV